MADPFSSVSYQSANDKTILLSSSNEERSTFTHADCHISDYQLEKLKFIAYSRLPVGAVRDADCVLDIYKELKAKYEKSAIAVSVLNVMLKVCGVDNHFESKSTSLSDIDDLPDGEFKWRKKIILYSDRAVKQKRVSKLIDYLYSTYSISKSKEHFTSSDSPMMLFQHMTDMDILQTEREKDMNQVGKFFKFWNKNKIATLSLALMCSILLAGAATSLLLLPQFLKDVRDLTQWKEIYYYGSVTALAVEEFDLRLHDRFRVDVYKNDYDGTMDRDYRICVCQRKYEPRMIVEEFITVNGTSETRIIFANYTVTGSKITFSFVPSNTQDLTSITLNVFTNATKCKLFSEVSPDLQPITLNKANGFRSTLKAEDDNFICAVVESKDQGSYSYIINGTIVRYQNVSYLNEQGLCSLHYCKMCNTNEISCVPDIPLKRSLISAQPEQTSIYFTVSDALMGLQINVSTTVFGTNQNINVVIPSLVGCVLFVLACGLIIPLCVISCRG